MFAHRLTVEQDSFPGFDTVFDWDSTQACEVASDLLAGESSPATPVTAGAFFNDIVNWESGELNVVDAPLAISASFSQTNGSIVTMTNENGPQGNVGVTIAAYYAMYDGSLIIGNAALTVADGGDLGIMYGSSVQVNASPVNVECHATLSLSIADSEFILSGNSPVDFGTAGNVSDGAATVAVGNSSEMIIGGSGAIDLGFCSLELNDGTLETARSIVETAAAASVGGTLTFNGGTLQATGDNSSWLDASPALTVTGAYSGASETIDSGVYDVTISAPFTGAGILYKEGDGTVTLTGASTSSGGAVVGAGTLIVDGTLPGTVSVDGPIGSGPVGTLAGTGKCSGKVDVSLGGILSLGGGSGPATITIHQLVLGTGAVVDDDDVGSQDTYLVDVTGALDIYSSDHCQRHRRGQLCTLSGALPIWRGELREQPLRASKL